MDEVDLSCSIPQGLIFNGGPGKDGIPALTNPTFVRPGDNGTAYLRGEDRVVGLHIDNQPYAIPLNIFWWHEIVNLDLDGTSVSITHCPLTGSSLGFDREAAGGAEFGVSGLLYQNNLIMYDRNSPESLWPQMLRGARCGSRDGTGLPMVPVVEMSWEGWLVRNPTTVVVSSETGWGRDYTRYPYGNYDAPQNASVLFPLEVDTRRPPKERGLGIPVGTGGVVFPYGILDDQGPLAAAQMVLDGNDIVVFWDRSAHGAMAYHATAQGQDLTFSVQDDRFVDEETGTAWLVDGTSVKGPLAGARLEPVEKAFVAFWFAWPAFYPDVEIWEGS